MKDSDDSHVHVLVLSQVFAPDKDVVKGGDLVRTPLTIVLYAKACRSVQSVRRALARPFWPLTTPVYGFTGD